MPETQTILTKLTQLPSTVFTTDDLATVIALLQSVQSSQTNHAAVLDSTPEVYKPLLLEFFSLTQSGGQSQLTTLIHELEHIPTATLTLAYQPNHRQVIALSRTLRRKAHPVTVLEILHDPTISAGCILEFQGKRFDRSVARLLGAQTI